jgi:hypothetical protein
MKTHVLRGSKHEIAQCLTQIDGDVREAIVFVDEPAPPPSAARTAADDNPDIFAEMRAFMVDAADIDDSRAAIYTRMDNE